MLYLLCVQKNKMRDQYVLDASALLALINQEPGSDRVAEVLQKSIMSAVNLSEVAAVLSGITIGEADIRMMLRELVAKVIPYDAEQAYTSAFLRKATKNLGLSLGDRACLALGRIKNLPVITADKIWQTLDCGVEIKLIR